MDRRTAMNVYLSCVLIGVACFMASLWTLSAGRHGLGTTLRYTGAAIVLVGVLVRFVGGRNRPTR